MPSEATSVHVLVAGIGGASLGTELLKCLSLANRYVIFGCDISPVAFGLYEPALRQAFMVTREKYAQSVLDVCRNSGVQAVIPGGEEPLALLNEARALFERKGVRIAGNSTDLVST